MDVAAQAELAGILLATGLGGVLLAHWCEPAVRRRRSRKAWRRCGKAMDRRLGR